MHIYFQYFAILRGLDAREGKLTEVGKTFFVDVVLFELAYKGLSRDVDSFEGHDALVLLSMGGFTESGDFIDLKRRAGLLELDVFLIVVIHIISMPIIMIPINTETVG